MVELKHVGRVKATGKKCLIAFRTLPGDASNCLIVPTENLPDDYHDALIRLVESSAGQEAYEFGEAMDRTPFPDGSRMLPSLHSKGRLIKTATANIEMTPTTGVTIVLSELNQIIAEQRGIPVDDLSLKSGEAEVKEVAKVTETPTPTDVTRTTSSSVNETETEPTSTPEEQAKFYRSKADKLAKEAAAMRRKAEELAPTVKKTATK
jgi:hypothetical protein